MSWGQGTINNTIGWGQGSTNAIGWGSVYANSPGGDTAISAPSYTNVYSTSYDGVDDYVTMGDVLDFERTDAFSISIWFKRGRSGTSEFLVAKQESTGNARGYTILLPSDDNKITFVLRNNTASSGRIIADSSTAITDTNWHHTLITYDGSSATSGIKIYLDGADNTGVLTGTLSATTSNTTPFQIGARNGGNPWLGKIDEVGIFDSELSSSDATAIYNSGTPLSLDDYSPIGYWRFEEGSGTTATDEGSGGNNGTLTNGTAYDTDIP